MASITVVAPIGLCADGVSTALFLLGPEQMMQLAAQRGNMDVLLIDKQSKIWKTLTLRESIT
ncbi:MAG: FAD:protein FMN transferase [Glaciimonas sp.]|nr:FAD:protein FMN transferase [Glaciimonas sp.]